MAFYIKKMIKDPTSLLSSNISIHYLNLSPGRFDLSSDGNNIEYDY